MSQPQNEIDTEQLANSDKQEWKKLFQFYYQILCKHAHRLVNDIHLAEDIAEIVFLKLWERRTTVTNIKFLKAYLIRAARNEALTYIEKETPKKEAFYAFDIEIHAPAKKASEPEIAAQQEELRKIITMCVEDLTAKQREVISHIFADGNASTRALGKTMGCSHKNVQAIIGRIRVRFRKIHHLLEE